MTPFDSAQREPAIEFTVQGATRMALYTREAAGAGARRFADNRKG